MRRLTEPRPDWVKKYVEEKTDRSRPSGINYLFAVGDHILDRFSHPSGLKTYENVIRCSEALVDYESLGRDAAVIGCGPNPASLQVLAKHDFSSIGIEPIDEAVTEANRGLKGEASVSKGTAEETGLADESQSLVLMENVLEHVDSIRKSLEEMYRILKPGGVLYALTTNRNRFSLTGVNWEYSVRYFNLFPKSVRESYVFLQLHYSPQIARYSPRPAVHWFSHADLCAHGRDVGFARFYGAADLWNHVNPPEKPMGKITARLLRNPWLRALHINMAPGEIFMWKRGKS